MSAECKETASSSAGSGRNGLMWDVSCNNSSVDYSSSMTIARVHSGGHYRIIRGPFWESGRHIVNIKILHKVKDGFGIGIVDKSFDVTANQYVGSTQDSSSLYQEGTVYDNAQSKGKFTGYKDNDMVTVDINFYKGTLEWAVNGNYVKHTVSHLPKQAALGINMYYVGDAVQIVQYFQM